MLTNFRRIKLMKTAKTPKRIGRPPSRAAEAAKALEGVDIAAVDPREVLRTIAADASAPHGARVAAARALITDERKGQPTPPAPAVTRVAERAIALMTSNRTRPN
jgi:hypothetical protein